MHTLKQKTLPISITAILSLMSLTLSAQGSGGSDNVYVISILIILGAIILVSALLTLSENLIQIEAQKVGLKAKESSFSVASLFQSIWGKPNPAYTGNDPVIRLSKGYELLLNGDADKEIVAASVNRYAIRPSEFLGLSPIPKMVVAVGDEVKAGDVLFHDKKDDQIKFVAPVSGEVVEIRRGEKRAITEVIILADKEQKFKKFVLPNLDQASRADLVHFLQESGGWTLINQRPYDMIPQPDAIPDNIFISTFDSAPLAPDNNLIVAQDPQAFQKGVELLSKLTTGKVYLGLNAGSTEAPHMAFTQIDHAEKVWFAGKHPAGNVGVQIHHIAPIRSGKKVWTLGVQEVMTLGNLISKGELDMTRYVAIVGSEAVKPRYVKTYMGASVSELTQGNVSKEKLRMIDGDVYSGRQVSEEDFLSIHSDMLTLIKEGDYYEIFGWLLPLAPRPTNSKAFPNFLYPDLKFDGDTNMHGEKRAFVMTGQYAEVLPMNIYPQHLMKAIMTGDFEQMEGLGIYELTEEDIAVCEFVCTSKMPLQSILRDGLEMMREQG